MRPKLILAQLAIVVAYSALIWYIARPAPGAATLGKATLMAFLLLVHILGLLAAASAFRSELEKRNTYFISAALVGLIGFGICSLHFQF